MSKISLTPNASGTGTFTIASPNGNTNRTLTLPDADGALLTVDGLPPSGTSNLSYLQGLPTYPQAVLPNGGFYTKDFSQGTVTGNFVGTDSSLSRVSSSIVPALTSYNTTSASGTGISITSSPAVQAADDLYDIFNGPSYGAQYTSNTWTLTLDFQSAIGVYAYQVERFANPTYQPQAWTFEGSTNNSTWVVLDTQTGQGTDWGIELKTFSLASSVSYRYYRFAFTGGAAAPTTGYVLDQLNLLGAATPADFTSETFGLTSTPSEATVNLLCKAGGVPVSGSDIIFEVSRDDGTSWSTAALTATALDTVQTGDYVMIGTADLSGQPSGTSLKYRIAQPATGSYDPTSINGLTLEFS